jgi:DNA invertase Pin-like site-specific DNA recombinase
MLSEYTIEKIKNSDIKMEYLELMLEPVIEKIFNKLLDDINKIGEEKQPLLTIDDIARRFKVTKATVHNWKNKGSIVGQKFGKNRYFTENEVRKSMAKYGFTKKWDNT